MQETSVQRRSNDQWLLTGQAHQKADHYRCVRAPPPPCCLRQQSSRSLADAGVIGRDIYGVASGDGDEEPFLGDHSEMKWEKLLKSMPSKNGAQAVVGSEIVTEIDGERFPLKALPSSSLLSIIPLITIIACFAYCSLV